MVVMLSFFVLLFVCFACLCLDIWSAGWEGKREEGKRRFAVVNYYFICVCCCVALDRQVSVMVCHSLGKKAACQVIYSFSGPHHC